MHCCAAVRGSRVRLVCKEDGCGMTGKRAAGVFMSDGKRECEAKYERNFARRGLPVRLVSGAGGPKTELVAEHRESEVATLPKVIQPECLGRGIASTPVAMRSGQETTDKEDWFDASI